MRLPFQPRVRDGARGSDYVEGYCQRLQIVAGIIETMEPLIIWEIQVALSYTLA
jgi:hypothetical protein